MTNLLSLLTLVALGGPGSGRAPHAPAMPADSIGMEMRNGQRFVKHRVSGGETLTALARRYRVTVDQLTAANPQIQNGLGIGQIVFVPRSALTKVPAQVATPVGTARPPVAAAPSGTPTRHTVVKGETLFGIAQRYHLTADELIKLNKLPSGGGVRIGQQLILSTAEAGGAVATAPATTPATAPPKPMPAPVVVRPAELESMPVNPPATPKTPAPAPDKPAQIATVTPAPAAARETERERDREEARTPTRASELLNRVVETGLGAPIDKSVTDKYLALHKTAPVGTIMEVKNSMNGLSVYVRVIGRLPNTGENDKILVRLSPRAVQKLGTADARFRVETNYIPQ